MRLNNSVIKRIVREALREDDAFSDITSQALLGDDLKAKSLIIVKQNCILCGIDLAEAVFKAIDPSIKFKTNYSDTSFIKKGKTIARINGKAKKILAAERVALNFLAHLSGIATLTSKFVKKIAGSKAKILDTRKTTPLLRALEKYAVRCGGGYNHRMSLSDLVIIKDNHKEILSLNLGRLTEKIRIMRGSKVRIEIEVENIREFKEAICLNPYRVMLDNFVSKQLRKCVLLRDSKAGKIKLEASGRVNLNNVRRIAKTGVDFISVGSLTHSAPAVDFSLEIIK